MEAREEREFLKRDVRKLKGSALLKKFGVLNKFIIQFFDFVCLLVRIFSLDDSLSSKIIVIISLHRLGDSVFTIPAIREIFRLYLNYKIFIICYPETKAIYKLTFPEDCLVDLSKNEFMFSRRIASSNARQKIKKLNSEIVIDITGTPASASLIWNQKARKKIGMNIRYLKNLYSSFTQIRREPHFIDIYLDVVKLITPSSQGFNLHQFEVEKDIGNKIIIHPFAIRKAKEWNLNKFISLAEELNLDYNIELIVPFGFLENEVINELNNLNITINITPTVADLIEKLKSCSIFIGNDSGPTYIASLLGKPTFTIYGPTNPKFSLPFGTNHQFIQKELRCTKFEEKICYLNGGINCPSNECMNTLSVSEVVKSVKQFIQEIKIERSN